MFASRVIVVSLLVLLVGSWIAAADLAPPVAVSPGSSADFSRIEGRCPTFSWGATTGALAYELVVYGLRELGDGSSAEESQTMVLRWHIPGSASTWTPSLGQCFESGGQFAWAVRSIDEDSESDWSEASLFEVSSMPSAREVQAALLLLQEYVASGGSLEVPVEMENESQRETFETPAAGVAQEPLPSEDEVANSSIEAVTFPGTAAIRGEQTDAAGATYGVHGLSESSQGNSAGLVGQSTAASGGTRGVVGQVSSNSGIAGLFENAAGGQILGGWNDGTEVFSVEGDGEVVASQFSGDGSQLTGVDADLIDGMDSSDFGDITAVTAGSGLTGGGTTGEVNLAIGAESVTGAHLATDSVGYTEIRPNSVGESEVVDDSILAKDLASGSVTSSELATGAVIGGAGGDIADGTITYQDTNVSSVQRRVTGTCGQHYAVDGVTNSGGVTCEYDDFNNMGYSDQISISNFNGGCSIVTHPRDRNVCFLTYVSLRDVDSASEDAYCNIIPDAQAGSDIWVLQACSEDDSDARCGMRCVQWGQTGRVD